MTEFISEIKSISHDERLVFNVLSDLNNLEGVRDMIPTDKVEDFSFDRDSCSFSVKPIGQIKFSVVNREPTKTIKFAADKSPVEVNFWIQLKQVDEHNTRMKLTLKADLNPFLKPMLSKPLQDGIDKIADFLAAVQYETLAEKYSD
jgi:carbon monoxide dehydrogenase subunit G